MKRGKSLSNFMLSRNMHLTDERSLILRPITSHRKMPGLLDGRDGDEAEDSLHHVLTPGNQNNIAISDDGDGEQQIDGGGDDNDDDEGLRSGVDVNKRYSHLAFSHLQAQNSDRRAMKKLLKMLFQKRFVLNVVVVIGV